MAERRCPACRGTGRICVAPQVRSDTEAKRIAAVALRDAGYSIRQTMRVLGYKSPRSVQDLLLESNMPHEPRIVTCPDYTVEDARLRWGDPGRVDSDQVERACPWCASWLRDKGRSEHVFDSTVECTNLSCPMIQASGKCYWEPYPDGWTEANKTEWITRPRTDSPDG